MKKTAIYFATILVMAFINFSCDDNEETADLLGNWNYEKPYIDLEYPGDTIKISMGQGAPMAISVDEIEAFYTQTGGIKMSQYFKGIEFTTATDMKINISMGTNSIAFPATYVQKNQILAVKLDIEALKELTGVTMPIPTISFTSEISGSQMTLFLEKVEIAAIISAMNPMLTPLIKQLLLDMNPGLAQMPDTVVNGMVEGLKQQISAIIGTSGKINVGMTFKKSAAK